MWRELLHKKLFLTLAFKTLVTIWRGWYCVGVGTWGKGLLEVGYMEFLDLAFIGGRLIGLRVLSSLYGLV